MTRVSDRRPDPGRDERSKRVRARRPYLRIGSLLLALVCLAALAAVVLPGIVLDAPTARKVLAERLQAISDEPVSFEGDASFSLLPRTRLVVDQVRIGRANALTIDRVIADLDPADALMGKTTISRLVLVRPEYRPAEPGVSLASDTGRDLPRDADLAFRDLTRRFISRYQGLQILEIRDGVFRLPGGGSGFSNANLTVTQAAEGSDMRLAGSFIWNGQPADVRLTINAPTQLLENAPSGVAFNLQSPPLSVNFNGQLDLDQNAAIVGQLQLATPSIDRGVDWIADPRHRSPDLGPVEIDGNLRIAGAQAALRNAEFTIAGSTGVGAFEADFSGATPMVGGTLAFSDLELDPFTQTVAPFPNQAYEFERPIDIGFSDQIKLDIRLSANSAMLGGVAMANMAAVLTVGDGRAKIEIGDASVFDGHGQAVLEMDRSANPPRIKGHVALSNVDSTRLFSALDIDAVTMVGRSNLSADIDAPLSNWGAILRSADIDANVSGRNGAIEGFDPQVFATPGVRPLVAGATGSRMPFDTLSASFAAHGQAVEMRSATITNSAGELSASGRFSTVKRDVDLQGSFEAATAEQPSAGSDPISFTMEGTWPNPNVTTRHQYTWQDAR